MALAATVACTALAGLASAAHGATPTVHVYDVQVTGVFRIVSLLPSKPLSLDFGYSETSSWTETYKGARLEVRVSEFEPGRIELRLQSKGTVSGRTSYQLSGPRVKRCAWISTRSEPGSLGLWGNPYPTAPAGQVSYRLDVRTGRNTAAVPRTPSDCTYVEGNRAKFADLPVGAEGAVGTGTVETRSVVLSVELRKPQQPGRLAFPLDRLHAGAGFVLSLKGKTKDETGRKTSEGTVRITFVPRPA